MSQFRFMIVVLLSVSAAAPAAQDAPRQPAQFRAEAELVVVDAVVLDDDGRPVTGLTAADFTIEEDGRPQMVQFFQPVVARTQAAGDERIRASRYGYSTNLGAEARPVRAFVLFFDDVHLTQEQGERAKRAMRRFLEQETQPNDLVSLVAPARALRWHARMPDGRAELLDAVSTLRGNRLLEPALERLSDYEAYRIHVMQDEQMAERIGRRFSNNRVAGRNPVDLQRDQGPRPELKGGTAGLIEPLVQVRAAEAYGRAAARTRATLQALAQTIEAMASVRGRKSLVVMSPGFVLDQELALFPQVEDAARRANIALYFVDARGLEVQSVFGSAQVGSPIDSRDVGAASAALLLDAEGAISLAEVSGGFAVQNSNDLEKGLRRIGRESEAYYLLGYMPADRRRDGRFRKLAVKVNRPDVEVRARKGYYPGGPAASGEDSGRAAGRGGPPALDPVEVALESPYDRVELPVRAAALSFGRRDGAATSVLLALETDLRSVDLQRQDGRLTGVLDLRMLVTDPATGETLRHERAVEMSLERAVPAADTSAWYPVSHPFELSPGRYQARIAVRDRTSGRIGSLTHDFTVPTRPGLALSSLIVTDAIEQTNQPGQPPRPVLIVRRLFPAGSTLYYQFSVFNAVEAPGGRPAVTAGHVIRAADGTIVRQMTPTPLQPGEHGLSRLAGVPLAGVPPGEYELEVSVHDGVGGQNVVSTAAFAIAGAARR